MAKIPLYQQKDIALGTDLQSFSPGFVAYGIIVDNDTGNWLLITPGNYIVPPWTYGWSQPLNGTQAVSVIVQPGPTIIPSVNLGTFVRLLLTEERVPQSNGFTAVTSASISSTIVIAGPVAVTGTVGINTPVDVSGSNVNANITNALTIAGVVSITGAVSVGGTVDVSGSTVTATISNTVTITGTVTIGNIVGGTVNIGTVTGDVSIVPGIFQVGGSGVTVVAVTGTRVALRATTAVKVIIVKARTANAGTLYLGDSTVTNNETATTGGLQLDPGDMVTFTETDIADIFINGTAGDGVSYMFWT